MFIQPYVGPFDQSSVKALLRHAGFIARHENHRSSFRIEGVRHAPDAVIRVETQLLHVGVSRSVESIRPGSPQLRTGYSQQLNKRQHLILHGLVQPVEFRQKGRMKSTRQAIGRLYL